MHAPSDPKLAHPCMQVCKPVWIAPTMRAKNALRMRIEEDAEQTDGGSVKVHLYERLGLMAQSWLQSALRLCRCERRFTAQLLSQHAGGGPQGVTPTPGLQRASGTRRTSMQGVPHASLDYIQAQQSPFEWGALSHRLDITEVQAPSTKPAPGQVEEGSGGGSAGSPSPDINAAVALLLPDAAAGLTAPSLPPDLPSAAAYLMNHPDDSRYTRDTQNPRWSYQSSDPGRSCPQHKAMQMYGQVYRHL